VAEIKTFQTAGFYNKPIGIVQPSSAGVQVGQALERAGATMANFAYERAVQEQTVAGKKAALRMRVRDEQGNLVYNDVSKDLSPLAQRQAEQLYNQSYLNALTKDIDVAFKGFADNTFDPEQFDALADEYRNQTLENVPEDFKAFAQDVSIATQAEYFNTVVAKKNKLEIERAYNDSVYNLEKYVNDAAPITQTKVIDVLGQSYEIQDPEQITQLTRDITNVVLSELNNFSDRVQVWGSTSRKDGALNKSIAFMKAHEKNVIFGYANGVQEFISKLPINPEQNDTMVQLRTEVMQGLSATVATGAIPTDISPVAQGILRQLGAEKIANSISLENRKDISSDINTQTNQMLKRQKDDVARVNLSVTEASTTTASKKDLDKFMSDSLNINSGQEAAIYLSQNLTNTNNPVTKMILLGSNELPQSVQDMFEDESMFLQLMSDPNTYATMRSLYDQMTIRTTTAGEVFIPRGLSEESIKNMETVKLMEKIGGVNMATKYLAKMSDPTFNPDALGKEIIKTSDEKANADSLVKDMFKDNPRLRLFAKENFNSLVGMTGDIKKAKAVLIEMDKNYKSSKYMGDGQRMLYTPEAIFGDSVGDWERLANQKLQTISKDYKLGENVFLRLSLRSDPKDPVYVAVDENDMAITSNGSAVLITGNALYNYQAQQKAKEIAKQKAKIAAGKIAAQQEQERRKESQEMQGMVEGIGGAPSDSALMKSIKNWIASSVQPDMPSETE